jgi:S-adenosylmethionine synthetase
MEKTKQKIPEVIERKGPGHPDTICDTLAENLAKNLKQKYKEQYGKVMHYNVDKVLASCGKVDYKKRKMIKPVKIVFSGNATKVKGLKNLLIKTVKESLSLEIRRGLKYKIYNHISECSPDLSNNFNNKRCNDTSFSVGHPITENEKEVLELGEFLELLALTTRSIGTDYKIMYVDTVKGEITIALALRCKIIKGYNEIKTELKESLKELYPKRKININVADKGESVFNTITGTSLEQGDAGMTGRGNRYNGLITPMKPMTMEAYCGKNDVTHIGRMYQKQAQELAQKINKNVLLVNNIGGDIKKPIRITWK